MQSISALIWPQVYRPGLYNLATLIMHSKKETQRLLTYKIRVSIELGGLEESMIFIERPKPIDVDKLSLSVATRRRLTI